MDLKLDALRNQLSDKKSHIFFDARVAYKKDKRVSVFYKNIKQAGDYYTFREVDAFIQNTGITSLFIWGSDDYSIYSYLVLKDFGYEVKGIVNLEHLRNVTSDIPLFLYEDVADEIRGKNVGVIIHQRDMKEVPGEIQQQENVLLLFSHVVGRCGKQYFDYFTSADEEYFLDAGCLDGGTSKDFIDWCGGNYGAVYAFEANPKMISECKKNLQQFTDIEKLKFYDIALWDEITTVSFDNSSSKWDAHVNPEGNVQVKADTIDHLLGGKKITYIKFDIEGSELKALYGARESILWNRPRMAISVYHEDDDLFKIMHYLIELNLNYKFALRHYHSDSIETILYVF